MVVSIKQFVKIKLKGYSFERRVIERKTLYEYLREWLFSRRSQRLRQPEATAARGC
jgi:hypothetical protein